MFGIKRIVIAEHERGIRLKNRSVTGILGPGVYYILDPLDRQAVQIYNLAVVEFEHAQLDTILKEHAALCAEFFQVVEPGEQQVGLVYKNGRLEAVLPPASRTVYWKGPVEVRVEVIDTDEALRIGKALATQLARPRAGTPLYGKVAEAVFSVEVADNQVGLLIIDGELREQLASGLHTFWRFGRSIKVELVDKRLQAMEVQGQEILTRDKVSLRINLAANYRVVDAVTARGELGNFVEHLY
ncbi:MAG TPA: SPFH domain-containing protein, partial [Gammaproteobacteria bacterium]